MTSPAHTGGGTGAQAAVAVFVTAVAAVGSVVMLVLGGIVGAGASQADQSGCGGAGTGQTIGAISLSAAQLANVDTIVTTTAAYQPALPAYAATVALATAYQESKFTNSTSQADHDSEGLFQQRVSVYGAAVAADPVRATQAFLNRLVEVPDWQTIPLTQAAADVQNPRTDLRGAYAQWQPLAEALTSQLWPTAAAANVEPTTSPAAPTTSTVPTGTATPSGGVTVPSAPCTGDNGAAPGTGTPPPGGTGNNVAGVTHIPAGLVMDGSAAGDQAVTFALQQLGKPYVFDAAGPNAYDCSGLTMAAWATAGIALEHWTGSQVDAGTPEPLDLSEAVSGDLVLIPGADGTMAHPGHVGMIAGYTLAAGVRRLYLVQAPMTGMDVEVTDTSEWAGQIAAVRHIA